MKVTRHPYGVHDDVMDRHIYMVLDSVTRDNYIAGQVGAEASLNAPSGGLLL